MLTQFKYAAKNNLSIKLGLVGLAAILTVIISILDAVGIAGLGFKITFLVFTSLLGGTAIVASVAASLKTAGDFYAAPKGYLHLLVPQKAEKMLGGNILSSTVIDYAVMTVATICIVLTSFFVADLSFLEFTPLDYIALTDIIFNLLSAFVTLLQFYSIVYFALAVKNSYLKHTPGNTFLAILVFLGVSYLSNFCNIVLLPFNSYYRYGAYVNISINESLSLQAAAFLLLLLIKAFVIFKLAARITEKRVDI